MATDTGHVSRPRSFASYSRRPHLYNNHDGSNGETKNTSRTTLEAPAVRMRSVSDRSGDIASHNKNYLSENYVPKDANRASWNEARSTSPSPVPIRVKHASGNSRVESNSKGEKTEKLEKSNSPLTVGRDLSLEEELQARVDSTADAVRLWRQRWRQEKDENIKLKEYIKAVETKCQELINDLSSSYKSKVEQLEGQLKSALESQTGMLTENNKLRLECLEMLERAEKSKKLLLAKHQTLQDQNEVMQNNLAQVQELNSELTNSLQNHILEEKRLTSELEASKVRSNDFTDGLYQILLEVALNKLKCVEDGLLAPTQQGNVPRPGLPYRLSVDEGDPTCMTMKSKTEDATRHLRSTINKNRLGMQPVRRKSRTVGDQRAVLSDSEVSVNPNRRRTISEPVSPTSAVSTPLMRSPLSQSPSPQSPKSIRRSSSIKPHPALEVLSETECKLKHRTSLKVPKINKQCTLDVNSNSDYANTPSVRKVSSVQIGQVTSGKIQPTNEKTVVVGDSNANILHQPKSAHSPQKTTSMLDVTSAEPSMEQPRERSNTLDGKSGRPRGMLEKRLSSRDLYDDEQQGSEEDPGTRNSGFEALRSRRNGIMAIPVGTVDQLKVKKTKGLDLTDMILRRLSSKDIHERDKKSPRRKSRSGKD